ncbi:MAG: DNA mismatch repair endonuclease MutL [Armatimonadetes bacterium]|nr:DNA mismatch repair endonuclease MutL [Armatimonadota bacterium]
MGRVRVLEKSVAERIAAGEVVERPASVVKELVENSLDAGASRVTVELQAGGLTRIRVVDDGFGMGPEDVRLAIERFATSKIERWEDMDALGSLGFRGEALPSIAAVSRLEIVTCERGASTGTELSVEGGVVEHLRASAAAEGTRITVTDLFFNTPARRKFLRSAGAETSEVVDLLARLALVRPDVHFRLVSNGRELLLLTPQMSLRQRLAAMWKVPEQDLVPVKGTVEGVSVEGYAAPPQHTRRNRTGQVFSINGRLIRSAMLSQAVHEGFSPMVERGRHPLAMLKLELDPASVDVNIHPTKAEVRFANQRSPFRAVHRSLAAVLEQARAETVCERHLEAALEPGPVPAYLPWERANNGPDPSPVRAREANGYPPAPPPPRFPTGAVLDMYRPPDRCEDGPPDRVEEELDLDFAQETRVLAQLYNSYLVALVEGELWIVDQHAAHERIQYERLDALSPLGGCVQGLVVPEVLDLPADKAVFLEEAAPEFARLGFEVEPFGGTAFQLRSVPSGIRPQDAMEVFRAVLDEASADVVSVRQTTPERLREKLRAMVACKSSIRARERLSEEEALALVKELALVERLRYCPHGRPTRARLDRKALERLFHR